MRICFLTHEYPPAVHGGIGSFLQTHARALVNAGHNVLVIGTYSIPNMIIEDDQGVRVVRLPQPLIRKMTLIVGASAIRQVIYEEHVRAPIDIIEGTESNLAMLSKSIPICKVIRMHGGHHFYAVTLGRRTHPVRSFIEKRSFSLADEMCGVSQYVVETTRQLLRLGNRSIEVIPNPVDVHMFQPQPNITEQLGQIIFIGTVVEKKGVFQLIRAMPQIVLSIPEAHLVIIGRDYKDLRTGRRSSIEIANEMIPSEIQDRVSFKGLVNRSEIPTILAQAQVAVYPSHMEAMPIAWLEGLAMGKAVVASQTGPGPEVIENGISGLLCNPFNPESIAEKVIQLLKDDQLRKWMGEKARKRAVDNFSIEKLVDRNLDFYQNAIAKYRGENRESV